MDKIILAVFLAGLVVGGIMMAIGSRRVKIVGAATCIAAIVIGVGGIIFLILK